MQTHQNILHHMRIWINSLHISCSDHASLLSSYAWDSAVQDVFGSLLSGATVYPFNVKGKKFSKMREWIEENNISLLHCTVALFREF